MTRFTSAMIPGLLIANEEQQNTGKGLTKFTVSIKDKKYLIMNSK